MPLLADVYETMFPDEWARCSEPRTIDEWRIKYTALDPTLQMSTDAKTTEEQACALKLLNAIAKDFMRDGHLLPAARANSSPLPADKPSQTVNVDRFALHGCASLMRMREVPDHLTTPAHLMEVEVFNPTAACVRFMFPDKCPRTMDNCALHCDDDDDDADGQ